MSRANLITRIGRANGRAQARAERGVTTPPERVNYLLGTSYDVSVTRLDREPFGPAKGRDNEKRTGPITTTEIPFQLVAGARAIVIASQDPNRSGLVLQNKDPTDNLYYAFGALADENSRFLAPGVVLLRDFNCPTDRISVFALVDLAGSLALEAPSG
jgi:hypothetical protein